MPYVKPKTTAFAAIGRLLKGYGASAAAVAGACNWSYAKARDRLNNPGHLTFDELELISRRFHIPKDEIVEAIAK